MPSSSSGGGFLSAHEWMTFGAFMLLLFGLSIIDRKIAVIVGVGAGVIMIAQHLPGGTARG